MNEENMDFTPAEQPEVEQVQVQEPKEEFESTLRFREEVVSKIVAIAIQEVDGILSMSGNFFSNLRESFGQSDKTKGVSVDMEEPGVVVNLEMVMEYGKSAPEIFESLKRIVGDKVHYMTGLDVLAINVRVVDILTREEWDAKQKKEEPKPEEPEEPEEEEKEEQPEEEQPEF